MPFLLYNRQEKDTKQLLNVAIICRTVALNRLGIHGTLVCGKDAVFQKVTKLGRQVLSLSKDERKVVDIALVPQLGPSWFLPSALL
jgi:hypothetical protein